MNTKILALLLLVTSSFMHAAQIAPQQINPPQTSLLRNLHGTCVRLSHNGYCRFFSAVTVFMSAVLYFRHPAPCESLTLLQRNKTFPNSVTLTCMEQDSFFIALKLAKECPSYNIDRVQQENCLYCHDVGSLENLKDYCPDNQRTPSTAEKLRQKIKAMQEKRKGH